MTSTLEAPLATASEELDSASQVLEFVRAEQEGVRLAEARIFAAAVTYAHQHPPESIAETAGWEGDSYGPSTTAAEAADQAVPIAGAGAPLVSEFCLAEFAAALGMSTTAGKSFVGHALEVHHRLPRVRALVEAGELPVWRARRVAEHTTSLCPEGAAYVDETVAPVAGKVGPITLDRLVTEALARFEPDRAREVAAKAAETRHVTTGPISPAPSSGPGTLAGNSFIAAELDTPDAEDFETAVQITAAQLGERQLAETGAAEPLDVRRAKAIGIISRDHLERTLRSDEPVESCASEEGDAEPARPSHQQKRVNRPARMVLHVHLSEAAVRACTCGSSGSSPLQLARIERGHSRAVLADLVRTWAGAALARGEQIKVQPVLDAEDHIHVGAYEVPNRLVEQTQQREHHCVFPWCTRPARSCDCDHAVAHARSGPTCSCNLAPLCRRHHRLKTHTAWSYVPLEPGTHVWTSPHGYSYLVDHTGTRDVTSPERRGRPLPPHAQQP